MTAEGVLEVRVYRALPGRGDRVLARFLDHTLALFADHGFRVLGFGRDQEDPDRICYMLRWSSREEMDRAWAAFRDDERWIAVRDDSERDGAIVDAIDRSFLDAYAADRR